MFDMLNSQFYNGLPAGVKEKVYNCGLIFETETELREFVVGLQHGTVPISFSNENNSTS